MKTQVSSIKLLQDRILCKSMIVYVTRVTQHQDDDDELTMTIKT